ncbi:MAG: PEP-CTERM sorting domain-containing protein [Planctomycetota bacterium]|nr:PEP-CTERM sorting domain-containing protein [Planctomycetota bacterium]
MRKTTTIAAVAAVLVLAGWQRAVLAGMDYPAFIASTNPVGWWGMNEAGAVTATADLSGTYGLAHNGVGVAMDMTYNAPGITTTTGVAGFVNGPGNKATYFAGNNPYSVSAGATTNGVMDSNTSHPVYHYPSGFSCEAWIKRDGVTRINGPTVMAGREWAFGFVEESGSYTDALHFITFTKQDYFSANGVIPDDGQWHQIGVSWDGATSTASFFVDGVGAGTQIASTPGMRNATDPSFNTFNLGRRVISTTGQEFRGWLDEAVVWDRQRTAADFTASYAAAVPEPATLSLLTLGGLAVIRKRRK